MAQGKRNGGAVEVIRAQRFELVDDTGQVIATLGAEHGCEGEGASLAIYDAEGRGRAWITGYEGGGNVHIGAPLGARARRRLRADRA